MKISPQEETIIPGHPKFRYDLKDPNVRQLIKSFGAEVERFKGPFKFDLYCISKGYYPKGKVEKVMFDDEEFERGNWESMNSGIKGNLVAIDFQKWNAYRFLQNQQEYAKAQIPVYEPDVIPDVLPF